MKPKRRPRCVLLAVLLSSLTVLGSAAPDASRTNHSDEVLSAAGREDWFQHYFDRMNAPKPLTRFRTRGEWSRYRTNLRQQVLRSLGLWPLPSRPTLDVRITGQTNHEGVTLARVRYQVLPGIYAAGWLYRPEAETPRQRRPAILNPHGHWAGGAIDPVVQTRCLALAKLGYVAFCPESTHVIDLPIGLCPIGQMTWNNMRALDLLESLPDVDPHRLGCTGASGGGQQTLYLAALDERVRAAVPAVLVSYFRRILFPSEASHCNCNHAPGIAGLTDETELAAMIAPRAVRFISATGDWTRDFPQNEFPEIQHIYRLLGGHVDSIQFDKPHNYDRDSREAMYAWMQRHLRAGPPSSTVTEPLVTPLPTNALVGLDKELPGVCGLDAAAAWYRSHRHFKSVPRLTARDLASSAGSLRANLPRLLGEPGRPFAGKAEKRGSIQRGGFQLESWLVETEPPTQIPVWTLPPPAVAPVRGFVVFACPNGKSAFLDRHEDLLRGLIAEGFLIALPDLRLRGELQRDWRWNEVIWGRPQVGMSAHDLNALGTWLRGRMPQTRPGVLIGWGDTAISALCAAALDSRWEAVAVEQVGATYERGREGGWIPNLLRFGDVPQIAALVSPGRLWLNGVNEDYDFTRQAFALGQAPERLECTRVSTAEFARALPHWLARLR